MIDLMGDLENMFFTYTNDFSWKKMAQMAQISKEKNKIQIAKLL
jgi:hypothetical protein